MSGDSCAQLKSFIENRKLAEIKELLAQDATLAEKPLDQAGNTALHLAVKQGAAALVVLIGSHVKNFGIQNFNKETCFHLTHNIIIKQILGELQLGTSKNPYVTRVCSAMREVRPRL